MVFHCIVPLILGILVYLLLCKSIPYVVLCFRYLYMLLFVGTALFRVHLRRYPVSNIDCFRRFLALSWLLQWMIAPNYRRVVESICKFFLSNRLAICSLRGRTWADLYDGTIRTTGYVYFFILFSLYRGFLTSAEISKFRLVMFGQSNASPNCIRTPSCIASDSLWGRGGGGGGMAISSTVRPSGLISRQPFHERSFRSAECSYYL